MTIVRERFEKVAQEFDAKIQALVEERSRMEQELRGVRNKFNELMIQDVENPSKETATALTKVTKQIDGLELELSLTEKRIEVIRNRREQALKELFPELVKARDEAVTKAKVAILEVMPELKKRRAELLLHLKALHDLSVDSREIHRELESIADVLGIEYRARFELPPLPLFDTAMAWMARWFPCNRRYWTLISPVAYRTSWRITDRQGRWSMRIPRDGS